VINLRNVISRTLLLGVSKSDISLQGVTSSSTPAEGGLRHLASEAGRLHLARTNIYGCARWKLKKKARASQEGTGSIKEPGNAVISRQGGTLTRASKRPRPEDSTLTERVISPKKAHELQGHIRGR
jgi:hypothetical protein